ncbi:uncharacterized protein BO96DRAFT_326409 [Aspergillus niger CBS 101883]|uniref:uncharacterized protein n=1 Tax=Aspergillus lacticoffeatus (strain CBS 101883) TaxID=1450533 RepID=UPI000D7EE2FE|nr:uncharacterized protein BO96DRAFT_326409 [Aspergillus niger CBS 101883]PYH61418.1 hypothetical protein BO96DRAFT_326409 [Aspergillus niger CBS 101883]
MAMKIPHSPVRMNEWLSQKEAATGPSAGDPGQRADPLCLAQFSDGSRSWFWQMGIDFPSDYPYPSKTGGPGQQHAHNRSIKDNLSHTPIDGCNSTNRQPDHRAALHHSLNFVFPIQHLPIKGCARAWISFENGVKDVLSSRPFLAAGAAGAAGGGGERSTSTVSSFSNGVSDAGVHASHLRGLGDDASMSAVKMTRQLGNERKIALHLTQIKGTWLGSLPVTRPVRNKLWIRPIGGIRPSSAVQLAILQIASNIPPTRRRAAKEDGLWGALHSPHFADSLPQPTMF